MDVTMPDGTVIQGVPEGTTKAQLAAKYQAHMGGQSPPAPGAVRSPKEKGGVLDGIDFVNGIFDWPDRLMASGVGLIAKGTDAVGLTDGADKMFSDMRNSAPGNKFSKAGAIIGDIGATLPASGIRMARALPQLARARPVVQGGARIADAALQGGAATLATSGANDMALGDQLTLGAGISAAVPTLGAVARGGKNLVRGVIGETTGAGGESLRNAYAAGRTGGEKAKAFTSNMRGNVDWEQTVNEAKDALSNMRTERAAAYRGGMVNIKGDKSVLDFKPVDDVLERINSVNSFKGKDLAKETTQVREKVFATIAEWKGLDPTEYHTPEGFDALKQSLGDLKDSYQYGTPQWKIASDAYNAVRGTIAKQAPAYDRVMRDYSRASDEISAIEKELSLGKKVNPNTALRKLQSVMRDNANTSWGKRADYAKRLEEAGADTLMPALAGQALSTPIPRGLAKYADGAAIGAATLAGNPMSLAALPFASPRLMGEAAYGLGAANRGARSLFEFMPPVPFPAIGSPAIGVTAPSLFSTR